MSALTDKGSTTAWRRVRAYVLARDGHRCQARGPQCLGIATTCGHIVPRIDGGNDRLDNLRAECVKCNYSDGARITARRRQAKGLNASRRWTR